MKKLISTFSVIATAISLLPNSVNAQNTFPVTGNVGIGTTMPHQKLEISGPDNGLMLTNVYGSTTPLYLYSGSGACNGAGISIYTTGNGGAADLTKLYK